MASSSVTDGAFLAAGSLDVAEYVVKGTCLSALWAKTSGTHAAGAAKWASICFDGEIAGGQPALVPLGLTGELSLIVAAKGRVYRIRASDGVIRWTFDLRRPACLSGDLVTAMPVVQLRTYSDPAIYKETDDLVFVSTRYGCTGAMTENRVVALYGATGGAPGTGLPRWTSQNTFNVPLGFGTGGVLRYDDSSLWYTFSRPANSSQFSLVRFNTQNGLAAMDVGTGTTRVMAVDAGDIRVMPMLRRNEVYVGSYDGTLHVRRQSDLSLIFSHAVASSGSGQLVWPIWVETRGGGGYSDLVVTATQDGRVQTTIVSTDLLGELRPLRGWSVLPGGALASGTPAMDPNIGKIYVPTTNGQLMQLTANTGEKEASVLVVGASTVSQPTPDFEGDLRSLTSLNRIRIAAHTSTATQLRTYCLPMPASGVSARQAGGASAGGGAEPALVFNNPCSSDAECAHTPWDTNCATGKCVDGACSAPAKVKGTACTPLCGAVGYCTAGQCFPSDGDQSGSCSCTEIGGGGCDAAQGQTCCGNPSAGGKGCRQLKDDHDACGACDKACGPSEICSDSKCIAARCVAFATGDEIESRQGGRISEVGVLANDGAGNCDFVRTETSGGLTVVTAYGPTGATDKQWTLPVTGDGSGVATDATYKSVWTVLPDGLVSITGPRTATPQLRLYAPEVLEAISPPPLAGVAVQTLATLGDGGYPDLIVYVGNWIDVGTLVAFNMRTVCAGSLCHYEPLGGMATVATGASPITNIAYGKTASTDGRVMYWRADGSLNWYCDPTTNDGAACQLGSSGTVTQPAGTTALRVGHGVDGEGNYLYATQSGGHWYVTEVHGVDLQARRLGSPEQWDCAACPKFPPAPFNSNAFTATIGFGIGRVTQGSTLHDYQASNAPNTCEPLLVDESNCGTCGWLCRGDQMCKNGTCGCPPGQTGFCSAWSINFDSNQTVMAAGYDLQGEAVFIVGMTDGSIAGQPYGGGGDLFVSKFSKHGQHIWSRVRGDTGLQNARGVAIDSESNVYITGITTTCFDPPGCGVRYRPYIMKYDANGNWQWTRYELGGAITGADIAIAPAIPGVKEETVVAFVASSGFRPAISEWSKTGVHQIFREIAPTTHFTSLTGGTIDNQGNAVAIAYEQNWGSIGTRTFMVKWDNTPARNQLWTRSHPATGWANENASRIKTDADGNYYIAGFTTEVRDGQPYGGGATDFMLLKYDPNGTHLWTRTRGGAGSEAGWAQGMGGLAITLDGVTVAGQTNIGFDGLTVQGPWDTIAVKWDLAGNHLFTRNIGNVGDDRSMSSVTSDSAYTAYVGGYGLPFTLGGCGDGVCSGNEDCASCQADCGKCLGTCGNNICEVGETCTNCAEDCGRCQVDTCGDYICSGSETCVNCAQDCFECATTCGDGLCDPGTIVSDGSPEAISYTTPHEDKHNCPQDCGEPVNSCGNGTCDAGESCARCEVDCGSCSGPSCGDAACGSYTYLGQQIAENCSRCPQDCGSCVSHAPACGNGECAGTGENCLTCSGDCGACPTTNTSRAWLQKLEQ